MFHGWTLPSFPQYDGTTNKNVGLAWSSTGRYLLLYASHFENSSSPSLLISPAPTFVN